MLGKMFMDNANFRKITMSIILFVLLVKNGCKCVLLLKCLEKIKVI